ncbi:MAG: glycosyltransferase family 9 protein [Solimonas sp.]
MPTFRDQLVSPRRILLANPAGLGDIIHTLPVAALLKRSYPDAQIDFLASAHAESLFTAVPYVHEVFSVPVYPRPKSRLELNVQRLKTAWRVRGAGYDAIINFKSIESTAVHVLLSGARRKFAVRSMCRRLERRWMYDAIVDRRWQNQPCWRYLCEALDEAGFAAADAALKPALLDLSRESLPPELQGRRYFHVSVFASKVSRQLAPEETRRLLLLLLERYPEHLLVLSCSAAPREVEEIRTLLPAHAGARVQLYPGDLSLARLAAVLAGADAHLGPDTGSLHLAWLAGARTVSWYLNHETLTAWAPYGPQHRVLLSLREQARDGGTGKAPVQHPIRAIRAEHVVEALDELLHATLPPREQWWGSDDIVFRMVCGSSGCREAAAVEPEPAGVGAWLAAS